MINGFVEVAMIDHANGAADICTSIGNYAKGA